MEEGLRITRCRRIAPYPPAVPPRSGQTKNRFLRARAAAEDYRHATPGYGLVNRRPIAALACVYAGVLLEGSEACNGGATLRAPFDAGSIARDAAAWSAGSTFTSTAACSASSVRRGRASLTPNVTSMGFGAGIIRNLNFSSSNSIKARAKRQRFFGSQSGAIALENISLCSANALR